jgi:hypothetical protein
MDAVQTAVEAVRQWASWAPTAGAVVVGAVVTMISLREWANRIAEQ